VLFKTGHDKTCDLSFVSLNFAAFKSYTEKITELVLVSGMVLGVKTPGVTSHHN
jgi:hypothetical protein